MNGRFCVDRQHEGSCYWLAKDDAAGHIVLVDGCHESPEGVAEAAKLHHRIFGAEDDWYMVKVEPMPPWGDAKINEEAARDCAGLVAWNQKEKP